MIKEFSVFQSWYACDISRTVTFLPPYVESLIPLVYLKQNAYVVAHMHGLDWYSGERPYSALEETLHQLTYGYSRLYVKGEEKKVLLQRLIPLAEVINIESLGCPRFDNMPAFSVPFHHHAHWIDSTRRCAGQNAKKIGIWLDFHLANKNGR